MSPLIFGWRALGDIERGLARDDPGLDALMTTLNEQFPQDGPQLPSSSASGAGRSHRSRRTVAVIALIVIAPLGLILTAVLGANGTPPSDTTDTGAAPFALSAQVHPAPYPRRAHLRTGSDPGDRRDGEGDLEGSPRQCERGAQRAIHLLRELHQWVQTSLEGHPRSRAPITAVWRV
ncbi:hypothetical protein GCM10010222_44550 [Streptomyces tanashiensis]|nr:hypothetical protein GCM10010222_44550 [Streptomyces tanashiensis]